MDLKVNIGNLTLKNPVIFGSCGYTRSMSGIKQQILKGYGAIVVKTVTIKPLEGAPKPTVFWYDPDQKTLLSGAEALKNPGIDKMIEAIEGVKDIAKQEDCKIIGSCSGNTVEEIVYMCKKYQQVGVSAVELNMGCRSTGPHLGKEYERLGKWWSNEINRAVQLIKAVKLAIDIPVWAKISFNQLIKKDFLRNLDEQSKPDAYSFIGGVMPNLTINIESGKPILSGNLHLQIREKIPICPTSHGPIKSSTILHTAYISKLTKTPLICAGGLTKGSDIVEALMAGAHSAQICSVVYKEPNSALKIIKEIREIMIKYKYKNLKEIQGISLRYLPDPPLLEIPRIK